MKLCCQRLFFGIYVQTNIRSIFIHKHLARHINLDFTTLPVTSEQLVQQTMLAVFVVHNNVRVVLAILLCL